MQQPTIFFFRKVTKAIHEQSSMLVHCSNMYMNSSQVEYAEKLLSKVPDKFEVI